MRRVWRELGVLGFAAIVLVPALRGQQAKQIVQQAVKTELAADENDHSRWLFFDVYRKPGETLEQWVAETGHGDLKRVLKENGNRLSAQDQRQEMNSYVDDPAAQARQRKSGHHDDEQARQMLSMLPQAFIWTKLSDQNGRTVLHFAPNPQFNPPSYEARVFAAMEGNMTVDDKQHRIAGLQGRMIHDVKFGWGLLGELKAGGTFDVERREVGNGVWQITETHVHVAGRALLFKDISDEEDDVKTHFREISPDLALTGAEKLLMAQNTDGTSPQNQTAEAKHPRAGGASVARSH
ncbi:MAG TPA: hypothetical protein VMT38_10595 [Terracidiphilus sp.]|nr:hypothetical protein [Terracidiphilus sp.]